MNEQPLDALSADDDRASSSSGSTLYDNDDVFEFAILGDTELLVRELQRGADIRAVDRDGRTLVFLAAEGGHTACVRALADRGADVNAVKSGGCTPVHCAAQNGHAETVRALADRGADVNAVKYGGWTPVHFAARNGHAETVRALADLGADVNAVTYGGFTPVYLAARNGHAETVRALADLGADVNTANSEGFTPVDIASEYGHAETVRALVEGGADVNTANFRGFAPVYLAAQNGHTETVRVLVGCGADVNTANFRGFTPLEAAAREGETETVWTLVREGGAELDRARQQRLAFAMARHPRLGGGSRASALSDLLLKMVLDPHVANRNEPASAMAARRGHARTANVLRFLEAQEGAAPVHAAANAARLAGFECPVCLESGGEARALAPCGHLVCRGCWARIESGDDDDRPFEKCPLCRGVDSLAVDPETFPGWGKLHERFCVQL